MKKAKSGQTMVEYIIIVAVIAVAGLVVFGLIGDVIKKKGSGVVSSFDEDLGSQAQAEAATSSAEGLKRLEADGSR